MNKTTQASLFTLARKSIEYYMQHQNVPSVHDMQEHIDNTNDNIHACSGVFVTLKIDNRLRGCIGTITSSDTIVENVIKYSCYAAFHDARFTRLQPSELDTYSLEMSILSDPVKLDDLNTNSIKIGHHGVILSKQGHRAVFLPKVATENKWDVETMLNHLSLKAGMSVDDWRIGAKFEIFTATEFKE